jgi:hypothetical protein
VKLCFVVESNKVIDGRGRIAEEKLVSLGIHEVVNMLKE